MLQWAVYIATKRPSLAPPGHLVGRHPNSFKWGPGCFSQLGPWFACAGHARCMRGVCQPSWWNSALGWVGVNGGLKGSFLPLSLNWLDDMLRMEVRKVGLLTPLAQLIRLYVANGVPNLDLLVPLARLIRLHVANGGPTLWFVCHSRSID